MAARIEMSETDDAELKINARSGNRTHALRMGSVNSTTELFELVRQLKQRFSTYVPKYVLLQQLYISYGYTYIPTNHLLIDD